MEIPPAPAINPFFRPNRLRGPQVRPRGCRKVDLAHTSPASLGNPTGLRDWIGLHGSSIITHGFSPPPAAPDARIGDLEPSARRRTTQGAPQAAPLDVVQISAEGRILGRAVEAVNQAAGLGDRPIHSAADQQQAAPGAPDPTQTPATTDNDTPDGDTELTEEQEREVQKLRHRDAEVRRHEEAHRSVLGRYARGGIQYEYEQGPDNRRYAVGGHVGVDASRESKPEATIRKAQIIRRGALAPAQPSGQDRAVAAQAARMEAEARAELRREKMEEPKTGGENNPDVLGPQETDQTGAGLDQDSSVSNQTRDFKLNGDETPKREMPHSFKGTQTLEHL